MSFNGLQFGKKHLSLILRCSIAGLACWFVFKDFDVTTLIRVRILTLFLAVGLFIGGICLIGVRWWVFLQAQKIKIPLIMAIKLTFVGQFFSNFMPSSVGGDIARAWYISRFTPKKMQAAIGVAADRLIGLISTFILAAFNYFVFLNGQIQFSQFIEKKSGGLFRGNSFSVVHLLLMGIALIGIGFLLSCFPGIKKLFRSGMNHLGHIFEQSKEVFKVYIHHPWVLILGLGLTLFLQSLVLLSLWLIGRDLGIPAGIQYYFVFFPMMWAISSLPLSIAGLGILEGGIVLLFVHVGAGEDAAKALALCQRLTWVLASVPGMVVHLAGLHRVKES